MCGRCPRPLAYRHPYGAVIWVTLTPANVEDFARLRDGAKS
jgi:hypothetical protein